MLGVLAVGDVDDVLVDDRRADDLVARLRPDRVLRVEIELPELLAGLGLVAADPAVALADDDLHRVADLADRGRRPLSVQDLLADGVVFPDQLAGRLVDGDDRRRLRRRHVDVALVLAVRGADVDQVLEHDRRGVRHVVLHHAELVHHVEPPEDVGVGVAGRLLVLDGPSLVLSRKPSASTAISSPRFDT